jgi:DNA-binding transcriptional ArsR family regulator
MMNIELDAHKLEEVAAKLRAIAHPMRIAIMSLLEKEGELNVTDIYEKLKIEQATASHHLNILKSKRVLESKRDGKKTFYKVRQDSIIRIADCISRCETE